MIKLYIKQIVSMAVREGFEPITLASLSFSGRTNSKGYSFTIGHKRTIKASFSFQKCSKICSGLIFSVSRSNKFETRGFESIATLHDTSKNNHLAIQQNQKTTSSNVKQPSSAYTPHTLIILCALLVSGCDQKNEVKEYLIDQGMTEIKTGGYDLSSCNSFELYATPFKAVQDGKKVSGVLCAQHDFKKPRIAYKKIN